jgi:hypothetical protein
LGDTNSATGKATIHEAQKDFAQIKKKFGVKPIFSITIINDSIKSMNVAIKNAKTKL